MPSRSDDDGGGDGSIRRDDIERRVQEMLDKRSRQFTDWRDERRAGDGVGAARDLTDSPPPSPPPRRSSERRPQNQGGADGDWVKAFGDPPPSPPPPPEESRRPPTATPPPPPPPSFAAASLTPPSAAAAPSLVREGYWGVSGVPLPPLHSQAWQGEGDFVRALSVVRAELASAASIARRAPSASQRCLLCGADLGTVELVDENNGVAFTDGYLHYAAQHHVVPSAPFWTYVMSAARAVTRARAARPAPPHHW